MDRYAWLGLASGLAIGAAYAWFQVRALRAGERRRLEAKPEKVRSQIPGALARMAFLVGCIFWLLRFTDVDKVWLAVGVVASYSIPFLWQLKQMISRDK